ncbi:MAG: protein translocase subunit SecD, partial [Lysobacter sp.]|nr:protein translocase subunit SecD [Lysobacter sp.]
MNKYPVWKYVLIAVALVVGIIYASPNLFGEVPVVQVSGARASVKVEGPMRGELEAAIKGAGLALSGVDAQDGQATFRFPDTDTQIKARDLIQSKVPPGYVVALNLQSSTPRWLQALGAKPMYLGLDLRGGVHFLLQVDMKAAANKSVERYLGDIRSLLRDKKIYYSGLAREGERVVVRFREADQRAAALKLVEKEMPDLAIREQAAGEEIAIVATIKPEVVKREQELALLQNIQTLRNRVNELGVAEPIIQQQGADRIVVQLAGVQDPGRAKEILGRTATLEVRMVSEEHAAGPGQNAFAAYKDQPAPFGTDKYMDAEGNVVLVKKMLVITGDR